MTIYVFTGPTLAAEQASTHLDAVYLPPVKQGDVYELTAKRPAAIGIIDGFFELVPSVWHKEILWAMSEGTHVFGSASMGALRAAELHDFGMVGVGQIFAAYRDGRLTDDDEVALRHGPAETGYLAVSEALVNIRWTLANAARRGIVSSTTADRMTRIAKALFYPERCYPRLLALGLDAGIAQDEILALREWLPDGRIDQKRKDAIAMLHQMRDHLEAGLGPKDASFLFEHTDMWEGVARTT